MRTSANVYNIHTERLCMSEPIEHSRQQLMLHYLACYLLYAIIIVLNVVLVFGVLPQAILALLGATLGPHSANSAIYLFSMMLIGLASFALVIGSEIYLRKGVERGLLMRRFLRLIIPLLIIGAALVGLRAWGISQL